jgi:hypothetical protein
VLGVWRMSTLSGLRDSVRAFVGRTLAMHLFVNREHFDVYVCPRCGRVEFFVDGVGEQYRPH